MYQIKDEIVKEYLIKNSKFICILYPLNNIEEVTLYLNKIKNIYKNATHYCYAYIFNNYQKYDDDHEPSQTAGLPILNILLKHHLTNSLCIIVRYFGGIKLGAGPLTRAYANCTNDTITKDNLITLEEGYNLDILFDYPKEKEVNFILKEAIINNKNYQDKILYNVDINKSTYNKLKLLDIKLLNITNKLTKKNDQ